MENLNLISNFAEFKELKNIDKSTMIGVLEDVFRHALQKQYETDENFDVIINPEKGDLEIWRNRTVVEDGAVENPNMQIAVSEVKAIDPTYEIGDEYADEIKLASFGRRTVLSLRQNLASRILDLEKANLYEKYSQKVGEIVTGDDGKVKVEQRRFFPEGAFVMTATGLDGTLGIGLWGVTPEELEQGGAFDSKRQQQYVTVTTWDTPDPVATWTKASGLFIPVMPNIYGHMIATIDTADNTEG